MAGDRLLAPAIVLSAAILGAAFIYSSGSNAPSPTPAAAETSTTTSTASAEVPVEAPVETTTPTTADRRDGEPFAGSLAFSWPDRCIVPVHETAQIDEAFSATLEYDMAIAPSAGGVQVTFENVRVIDLSYPGPDPVGDHAAAEFAMPSFVFDADGALVDVAHVDELFAGYAALDPTMDPSVIPPDIQQLVAFGLADTYWMAWTGLWSSWGEVRPGAESDELETASGDPVLVTVTSLRTTADGHAVLHADLEMQLDVTDETIALMNGFGDMPAPSTPLTATKLVSLDVVTDPETLRPREVTMDHRKEAGSAAVRESHHEVRTWAFDWPSEGCD